MKIGKNTIVLAAAWVVILGVGIYFTFVRQPRELELLRKTEELAQMKNTELTSLQTQHVALSQETNETLRKWHARYKVIPEVLDAAVVVGRLNELTREGFKTFDLTFGGATQESDYSYYTFNAVGQGYFSDLYRVIWELENGHDFYRVRDLSLDHIDLLTKDAKTGGERLQVMVSFTLRIEAYFAGIEGASAPVDAPSLGDAEHPAEHVAGLPPVPAALLPSRQPSTNPFFPGIMEQIPPNTYNLIDVEEAGLVSIVGQQAVFQDETGFRTAGVGDEVYLGKIVTVDPMEGRVVAHLNKGGIYDEVVLRLDTGARHHQAQGDLKLTPATL